MELLFMEFQNVQLDCNFTCVIKTFYVQKWSFEKSELKDLLIKSFL